MWYFNLIDLFKRPKIKACDYRALITKGILDGGSKYIWNDCFDATIINADKNEKENDGNAMNSKIEETDLSSDDDFILECINFGQKLQKKFHKILKKHQTLIQFLN